MLSRITSFRTYSRRKRKGLHSCRDLIAWNTYILTTIQKRKELVTFTYDSFNRRLTRNNEPFYFCRENEIGHQNSLRILGRGLGGDIGAAIAIELDGIPYAPLHDHNGSIIALLNLHGPLSASWQLTAYGELLGSSPSPWTFSSKRTEPLTNWLSFPHRDYAPETDRWTTPDPLGYSAGPNLYTYVSNNPLTHLDPLGLFEFGFSLGGPSFLPPLVSAPTVFMDPMSAANSLNGPRIDGAMRTIYGFSEMSCGASAMSTGIGLVPGGILFSHGLDNAQSGLHQMFLGEYVTPLTSQLFQAAGINESDANFGNDLLTLSSAVKSTFNSVFHSGGLTEKVFNFSAQATKIIPEGVFKWNKLSQGQLLKQHLKQLQDYGSKGFRQLSNGRMRYYGGMDPSKLKGEMAGRRLVREWNPITDLKRTWHETLDHNGNVRIVRPENNNMQKIHYIFDVEGSFVGKR